MHEMSLVRSVVDIVLECCAGQNVAEVKLVKLTIGQARDVVEHYVPDLFRYLARGTVAENARVEITRVPLRVKCRRCGEVFPIDVHDERSWECPACHVYRDYDVCSGMEFLVSDIEVVTAEEVGANAEPTLSAAIGA